LDGKISSGQNVGKCQNHFTVEYLDRRKHLTIEAKQGFGSDSNVTEQEQEQSDVYKWQQSQPN